MKKQEETRTDRLRCHLDKYKYLYLGIGIGIVVGAGVTLSKSHIVVIKESFNNNTIKIDMKGHPGNIIEDLDTGVLYPSQNQAAKSLGIDTSDLSRHLNGIHIKEGLNLVNHGMNLKGAVDS